MGLLGACKRIEIAEVAHPVPDAAGESAAWRLLRFVKGLTVDDLVPSLISGGGSSLLPLALPGLKLADRQALDRALLARGASSGEMNCVRRHLSAVKGGRLAAACLPARVLNLLLASGSHDGPVRIWDLDPRQRIGQGRLGGAVATMTFDSVGRRLAAGLDPHRPTLL